MGTIYKNANGNCMSDLRLMSIVASRRWSCNFTTLNKLYLGLILPKLDYAGFLIQTATGTLLKAIDRIQYLVARIMLGALKCTPTFY